MAAIEAEGGRAEFIAADLNDIKAVRRLAEQVGEVDVLVNNAAVHQSAPTLEQDVESFDMMFDVNVRGPFFLTAALLPKMIARGSGVIVNISGALASVGDANAPVGAAAKAAIESLTRSWAAAFGVNGIRVNTVAPGPTRTDSAVGAFGDPLEKLGSATPLGRTAHPNEIAEVIVFRRRRGRVISPARAWRWSAVTPRSDQCRRSGPGNRQREPTGVRKRSRAELNGMCIRAPQSQPVEEHRAGEHDSRQARERPHWLMLPMAPSACGPVAAAL